MRGPSNSPVPVDERAELRRAERCADAAAPVAVRWRAADAEVAAARRRCGRAAVGGAAPARPVRRAQRCGARLAGRRRLRQARRADAGTLAPPDAACSRRAVAAVADAAARRHVAGRRSAAANPASRCRCRRIPTSSGRRATATRSRAATRTSVARARCRRGSTRSTPSRPVPEVPLSLDAAARDRSVRRRDGVLRLPGHLQDDRQGPDVAGDQSGSLDAGSESHRRRPAASSATTSGSSTASSCSRSRRRRFRRACIWAGTNDGKLWYTKNGGDELDRRDEEHHGHARRSATVTQISPSNFDPAHGVRRRSTRT